LDNGGGSVFGMLLVVVLVHHFPDDVHVLLVALLTLPVLELFALLLQEAYVLVDDVSPE